MDHCVDLIQGTVYYIWGPDIAANETKIVLKTQTRHRMAPMQ
jgi:hypothetical protein